MVFERTPAIFFPLFCFGLKMFRTQEVQCGSHLIIYHG